MLSQLAPMVLFGIATAFSPGPNNIMTSYTAFNFGVRKAIPTMLGVILGWTLLIILLQFGSVSIFQKYQFIQSIIKVLGSIYLLYMAYKLSFGGQSNDKKLDPNLHQAMMEVENDNKEPGTIIQEIQKGFMIKNRLLRPSLVGVSKKTENKDEKSEENKENLDK